MKQEEAPVYVSAETLAKRFDCSRRYITELVNRGVLPCSRLGKRCVRIPYDKALKVMQDLETT